MCKIVESENGSPPTLKFDRAEWFKFIGSMVVIAALANGGVILALRMHVADTQKHQDVETKNRQTYAIVDREVEDVMDLMEAAVSELKTMNVNLNRRLTLLEDDR